jgi:hypothetical protein
VSILNIGELDCYDRAWLISLLCLLIELHIGGPLPPIRLIIEVGGDRLVESCMHRKVPVWQDCIITIISSLPLAGLSTSLPQALPVKQLVLHTQQQLLPSCSAGTAGCMHLLIIHLQGGGEMEGRPVRNRMTVVPGRLSGNGGE